MDGFTLPKIPPHILQPGVKKEDINAEAVIEAWISKLRQAFETKSFIGNLDDLFIDDCWWRDIVGLHWNFSSKHGKEDIANYLSSAPNTLSELECSRSGGIKPFVIEVPGMIWVQSAFTFKTAFGSGTGLVKLLNVEGNEWKAWTVFTQLEKFDFQKDIEVKRQQHPATLSKNNSSSQGPATQESSASRDDLQVLIVGAGQAGLSIGARLHHMGIKTVIAERHARVGDVWRKRYLSVRLNTPTYTDHPPFMKIPETWPRWLSGAQVASFWEHYQEMMGLDVLTSANVISAVYNETERRYKVIIQRDDWTMTLYPRHVVLATGVFSDRPIVPTFPGQEQFQGQIYHSSQHSTAQSVQNLPQKNVVVIGPGTSGHDVAQDFVNHGAKAVSLVQRSDIFFLSAESCEAIQLFLWKMEGLTTEEADLIGNSTPLAVIRTMSIGMTKAMAEIDKDTIVGLKKAGMILNTGEDGFGLADYQLIYGGRYYLDQGASEMVVDGRIKVHSCEKGVKELQNEAVVLEDGTQVKADIIVLATGYHSNAETVEKIMGSEVAQKLSSTFGRMDSENERDGWWRPTGQPGFWFMTGSFMWCRQYSLALALQIAAVEKGFNESHYGKK
ncbi:unnamed protein product [Clonostachys rosea]|uniref:FAD/NAD(P)-binding domain-containing protein n=1 Tax=Bionectria ochroleuca TaxID=29856 RepID=A0ABY6UQL8_BIOOC|nr:unnamed protein product [Clonostachys rosea]